jgi:hypothetical protein
VILGEVFSVDRGTLCCLDALFGCNVQGEPTHWCRAPIRLLSSNLDQRESISTVSNCADSSSWNCVRCTFENSRGTSTCDACGSLGKATDAGNWACEACTSLNGGGLVCAVCSSPRLTDSNDPNCNLRQEYYECSAFFWASSENLD